MGTFDLAYIPSSDLALASFQPMDQSVQKTSEVMDSPQTSFQVNHMVEWWTSVRLQLTSIAKADMQLPVN